MSSTAGFPKCRAISEPKIHICFKTLFLKRSQTRASEQIGMILCRYGQQIGEMEECFVEILSGDILKRQKENRLFPHVLFAESFVLRNGQPSEKLFLKVLGIAVETDGI